MPLPFALSHPNNSAYTLRAVASTDGLQVPSQPPYTDTDSLLVHDCPSYGTASPPSPSPPSPRKLIINSTLKMASLFIVSCFVLGLALWIALPTLDAQDRPMLKIPKSFVELQALNTLLNKYRDIYPYRILICYVTTYLFLQAFSLPGSMYLSILGGAVWGVPRALPLACTCVATGATFCYLISAALGPALLTLPKLRSLMEKWTSKIQNQKDNMIPFLIVLRIAPLPPHWVVNVICPHVGIGIIPFWISTFLGVFGVSVIHTTIGRGLGDMTSAEDFHLISWKNFFGLAAIVVGVLIPVGLRYYFRRELETVRQSEEDVDDGREEVSIFAPDNDNVIFANGPRPGVGKAKYNYQDEDEEGDDDLSDDDEDVILETGPVLRDKSNHRAN